jgi:DNA-binding CsgD family transcriptional regulator
MQKKLKGSILELRKEGLSMKQISGKLKCSISTVSFHLNNEGLGGILSIKKTDLLFGLSNDDIDKISEERKKGLTYKEINKKLNISQDKIAKICKVNNLPKSHKFFISEECVKNINIQYDLHKSINKVSKILKLSKRTVRKYLYKIHIRKEDILIRKKKNVEHVNNARRKRKIELLEYKGGKCEVCGYSKSIYSLQFHHLDPEKKDFTIGGRNYSWERMKKEVDKCILVCANCHCEIHEEIREKGDSEIINKIVSYN